MTIEERFEKIEKQNRNMKKWLAGVAALALAAIVAGTAVWVRAADGTFDNVYATNVFAKNIYAGDGTRTRVGLVGSNGSIFLHDATGKLRTWLVSDGRAQFRDPNGGIRVALIGAEGRVSIYNATGQRVATFDPAGIAAQAITLVNSANQKRLVFNGANGYIYAFDLNGQLRASLSSDGTIGVRDSNQNARIILNASDGKIYFQNASGGTVATHP